MTKLPAWVEEELGRWSSKQGKGYLNVFKALEIAWEALDYYKRMHDGKQNIHDAATDAMRRIEEMGSK